MGRYCFHRCLSVHTGGGGYPISHNTSTGPMSFRGGTPVTDPRSLPGEGVLQPGPDGGYPGQVQTGGTPARAGVPDHMG